MAASTQALVDYAAWVTEAAELLWFPRSGNGSPLLPQVPRGRAISEWPQSTPIAVEMNQALSVGGFQLETPSNMPIGSVEDLELHAGVDPTGERTLPNATARELPLVAVMTDRSLRTQTVRWTGVLLCGGELRTVVQESASSTDTATIVPSQSSWLATHRWSILLLAKRSKAARYSM